jgi:CBS domain containing-hemolysin-like protein
LDESTPSTKSTFQVHTTNEGFFDEHHYTAAISFFLAKRSAEQTMQPRAEMFIINLHLREIGADIIVCRQDRYQFNLR